MRCHGGSTSDPNLTLKATVDGALDEVLALDRRRRGLLAERGVDVESLADPAKRRAAWG